MTKIMVSDRAAATELTALVKRTNKDKPAPEDVQTLRRVFEEAEGALLWRAIGNIAATATEDAINAWFSTALTREAVTRMVEDLKDQLGYAQSPALECMLIDQVVLCWLRLHQLEAAYTNRLVAPNSHTHESGLYWDKRLNSAQRRYTRACESLARVRKLTRGLPPVQINIAADGGQQINVAGG